MTLLQSKKISVITAYTEAFRAYLSQAQFFIPFSLIAVLIKYVETYFIPYTYETYTSITVPFLSFSLPFSAGNLLWFVTIFPLTALCFYQLLRCGDDALKGKRFSFQALFNFSSHSFLLFFLSQIIWALLLNLLMYIPHLLFIAFEQIMNVMKFKMLFYASQMVSLASAIVHAPFMFVFLISLVLVVVLLAVAFYSVNSFFVGYSIALSFTDSLKKDASYSYECATGNRWRILFLNAPLFFIVMVLKLLSWYFVDISLLQDFFAPFFVLINIHAFRQLMSPPEEHETIIDL
ncbi:hypothetical protein H0X06_00635 [Candidatus Dependentiae bacterium]|nr:hypothetical protein [Candidatus Dependentiae bacterium]